MEILKEKINILGHILDNHREQINLLQKYYEKLPKTISSSSTAECFKGSLNFKQEK